MAGFGAATVINVQPLLNTQVILFRKVQRLHPNL
jgi:hypothetical protein